MPLFLLLGLGFQIMPPIAGSLFLAFDFPFPSSSGWLCCEPLNISAANEQASANFECFQALTCDQVCDTLTGDAAEACCFCLRDPLVSREITDGA